MMTLPDDDLELGSDLFLIVKELITQFHLAEKGYRLITNGGFNQTIPQWHWHLVSDAGTE